VSDPVHRTPSSPASEEAVRAQEAVLVQAQQAETFLRFRRTMLVGAITWPAFALADLLALNTFGRDLAPMVLLGPRFLFTFIGLLSIAYAYSRRTASLRTLILLDQGLYGQANVWLGVMCLSLGGLRSPYLMGACLVVTARLFSLPFEWKRALALNAFPALAAPVTVLIGVALRPDLRPQLHDPDALATFTLNVAYLAGTAILMTAGAHLIHTLRTQLSAERNIGRYRLRRRLGVGGMGEVWAAWHSGLKRDVALKILKPGSNELTAAARFEREVQATAELTHPNTVRVFDYGVTDDGLLYYAMELLRGEDLGSLVAREGALAPARAVYLVNQAARALAEAHARGIVHRDVKPENLFVTAAGSEGDFVKVLDFGIARIESAAEAEAAAKLTSNDVVVGTPRYMAPEVMRGGVATPRADVYGLGAVLHFALTGQPAFAAPNSLELVALVLGPDEAPAIARDGVSPELAGVVSFALAKDPARRFEHAGALCDALDALREARQWRPARSEVAHVAPVAPPSEPILPSPATRSTTTDETVDLSRR
jgi:serine/threonine-protein kinase